jgi:hypothetical protein
VTLTEYKKLLTLLEEFEEAYYQLGWEQGTDQDSEEVDDAQHRAMLANNALYAYLRGLVQ